MSKSQRNKGQRGERELTSLLSDELGFVVKRNLSQTRGGGADCIDIPGWSVECKFQETLNINAWWKQTLDQTQDGCMPILFYRQSRGQWRAVILLEAINIDYVGSQYTATVDFQTACMLIRESL